MALTREEEDRKKFSGEGTGIKRTGPPSFMDTVRAADRKLGQGINYVGENLPKLPGKVWDATGVQRQGVSGEINPGQTIAAGFKRGMTALGSIPSGAALAAEAGMSRQPAVAPAVAQQNEQPGPAAQQLAGQGQPQQQPSGPFVDTAKWEGDVLQPYGVKREPVAQPQPTVKDGWTSTTDQSVYGGQVLSMNPGQEGGGWGYQSGPARGNLDMNSVARQNLQGRGQVGGYSFEGRGADFARFAQQPTRPAGWDGNTVASQPAAYLGVRDRYDANRAAQDQLAGLDPRSGWGWKGRRELYMAQQGLDQRDREMGTRAVMDAARMQQDRQQAAAALAQDQRQFEAGQQGRDVDVQAKQAELGFNRQKQEVLDRLNASTDPEERRRLTSQLLAMQGKDPAQKYQVVTRKGFDPVTQMPTETPYAVNQEDPTQSFEIRGQGGQGDAAMSVISGNPAYQKAYRNASPEQQAEMLRKVRERLAQGGGQ